MAGFDNDVMYAKNADFTQSDNQAPLEANGLATNGQLWIGRTAVNAGGTHIDVATLTAGAGVTITNGAGSITIGLAGGAVAVEHLTGNTGGQLNPDGSNNFNTLGTGSITIAGSGSTLTTQLTGLTNHAVLVGAGTTTITKLAVGSNGQILIGSTSADPVFATPTSTGGSYIAGAGTSKYIPANYAPGSSNIAFSYSSPTFTVHGFDGTALSATNPGYITLQSKSAPGKYVTITVTANQTFTDGTTGTTDNARFGLLTGVSWAQDIPFFLYAVMDDTEALVNFMISRNPAAHISPVNTSISKTGAIINVNDADFFSLDNITVTSYDSNPCINLGVFRMQFAGATDSWTVQALSAQYDGIGNFGESKTYVMPLAAQGAAAGSYFLANGGTAPIWTTQQMTYQISKDGQVIVNVSLATNSTAGTGAVTAQMSIPYIMKTLTVPFNGILDLFNSGTSVHITFNPFSAVSAQPYTNFIITANAGLTGNTFFGTNTSVFGSFRYFPFLY